MSGEPAILGRIREALESALPPGQSALVLLDALARWGPRVPADVDELAAFAESALTEALGRRVDAARTLRVLRAVEEILATAAAPTQEHARPDGASRPAFADEAATDTLEIVAAPVPVVVIAGGRTLASRLAAALGPERVDVRTARDDASIARALGAGPLIAIVDGTDVPAISPEALFARLEASSPRATRIVWGSELPFGRRVSALAERSERPWSALRLADGMGSMLDLVLARRAPA